MCVSCSTGHSFDCVRAGFCRPELFEPRGRKDVVFEVELKRELEDHRASVLVVLGKVGQRPFGFELIGNSQKGGVGGVVFDTEDGQPGGLANRRGRIEKTGKGFSERAATDYELFI